MGRERTFAQNLAVSLQMSTVKSSNLWLRENIADNTSLRCEDSLRSRCQLRIYALSPRAPLRCAMASMKCTGMVVVSGMSSQIDGPCRMTERNREQVFEQYVVARARILLRISSGRHSMVSLGRRARYPETRASSVTVGRDPRVPKRSSARLSHSLTELMLDHSSEFGLLQGHDKVRILLLLYE